MKQKFSPGDDIYYVKMADNNSIKNVPRTDHAVCPARLDSLVWQAGDDKAYRLVGADGKSTIVFGDAIAATREEAVEMAKAKIMACIESDTAQMKRLQLSIDAYRQALARL